jgi:hypothetical protein
MKIQLLPKSSLGKWSIGLILAFFVLFAIGNIVVAIQGPIAGQTFLSNPILSIPMLSSAVAGGLSFFTGFIAIIKNRDRSVLVFLATIIGLLILDFVVGNMLFSY